MTRVGDFGDTTAGELIVDVNAIKRHLNRRTSLAGDIGRLPGGFVRPS